MSFEIKKTKRLARGWVTALAVATLALVPVGPLNAQQGEGPPPATVEVINAEMRLMAPAITVPGSVVSMNDARIASETAGRVTWIAEPGAILAEGDPVARLDARLIELEIKDNESIIRQLTAQLRFESRQYDRMKELAARNNAPAQRLDETLSARDVTEQQLAQARNALARSELQLERSVIRAPFPGRVVERLIQVGEFANTGLEIARLVDTTHTEIRAQAPLSVARYVKPGDPVRIEYDGTSEITQVRAIIPVGDEVSRSLEVRVLSTPNVAIIGSAVRVQLANAEPREVIAIPRDALIIRRTGVFAFKVGGEDKAERIVITIGVSDGEWVEALGPLTAGDRMVVRGGERLRPGQKLVINGES